ncbi:hypothetical protein [Methylobacterium sp. WL19]|uniref:hypothetical protein n=1 Tax=Methylobacterium sp. WL19 TaxID=2603896 RepID=UPI0011C83A5A|nr:hypothetical protein [Methylobacterium sp. WL19]TXN33939.1 hypothetical protein FV220_00380 [Methylobacterium sp. WL19]
MSVENIEQEIWEAIRKHSSPTVSREGKEGYVSMHGGQGGIILWERDGKPFVIAEIMKIVRRERSTSSLTNPNTKREDEREAKATDVIGYLNVYRDDDGDLVTGSSDLCATAEEASDFAASDFADHVGVFALVPAASARTSPGDPVRAALEEAHEPSHDRLSRIEWQMRQHGGVDTDDMEWMAQMARAALSVSTPTGEGEAVENLRHILTGVNKMLGGNATVESPEDHVTWIASCLQGLKSRVEHALSAALAHPPQGGERDGWKPISEARHDCTLYELEVPSDGKGLRDAETSITVGSNNGDHDGEDRLTYAGWSWCQDRYIHMDTADGAPMPIRFREIRPDHLGRSASEPDPAVSPGNGHHLSYSGKPMPPDGIEGCVYCGQPFKEGDLVLNEYEGGLGHIGCFGPERESYVGRDGEPLRDGEPIPTGRPWIPTSASKSSGEEA